MSAPHRKGHDARGLNPRTDVSVAVSVAVSDGVSDAVPDAVRVAVVVDVTAAVGVGERVDAADGVGVDEPERVAVIVRVSVAVAVAVIVAVIVRVSVPDGVGEPVGERVRENASAVASAVEAHDFGSTNVRDPRLRGIPPLRRRGPLPPSPRHTGKLGPRVATHMRRRKPCQRAHPWQQPCPIRSR